MFDSEKTRYQPVDAQSEEDIMIAKKANTIHALNGRQWSPPGHGDSFDCAGAFRLPFGIAALLVSMVAVIQHHPTTRHYLGASTLIRRIRAVLVRSLTGLFSSQFGIAV